MSHGDNPRDSFYLENFESWGLSLWLILIQRTISGLLISGFDLTLDLRVWTEK